ncbi:MAG: hypothetical protein LBD28_02585 [Tannerellaceae bacterium]|jgi:hypothetical protein|nr:hypothetical protein [Tannerellaceae bacterium]
MKAQNKYSGLIAFILAGGALFAGNKLCAQATIGSNASPARAALLDLKTMEAVNPPHANDTLNISSLTGGLLLPRVKLINRATLEPFISTSDPEWLNNSASKIKEKHAGLTVFNISDNRPPFKVGAYIWNGYSWMTPSAKPVIVGHGIVMNGNNMQLDLQLRQSVAFNTANELRISGSIPMDVTMPVRLSNAFQYTYNSPKKYQIIRSDANGNAVWVDNNTVPADAPRVIYNLAGADVIVGRSEPYLPRDTFGTVELPPGRWLVMVTMLAEMGRGDNNKYLIETSFFREGHSGSAPDPADFIGNSSLISATISNGFNTVNGYVIIENKKDKRLKYYYKVTKITSIGAKRTTNAYIGQFGSRNYWDINSIVAFALVP